MNYDQVDIIDLGAVSIETCGAASFGNEDTEPGTKYLLSGIEAED